MSCGFHVVEYALEALVGWAFWTIQPMVDVSDLLEHMSVVCNEVSHLDEDVHDLDAYLYCRITSEDGGEHGNTLLGEDPWKVASAAATFDRL